jgi:hypothetical protein
MSSTKITGGRIAEAAGTGHPRMRLEHRVSLAAAFALAHVGEGFTIPMLAAALDCSEEVAGYTRSELERQLAASPIQLRDIGWTPTDEDHHHDRHLYCLAPR